MAPRSKKPARTGSTAATVGYEAQLWRMADGPGAARRSRASKATEYRERYTCGRGTPYSGCRLAIRKGVDCYDIPQPKKPHSAKRRFCAGCFAGLKQTRRDLEPLEALN